MIDRAALEQLRCLLLEVDGIGNILDASGGLDGVAGRAAHDFVGSHAFDFVSPADHELLAQIFLPPPEGVPINRRGVPFELTLLAPDGREEHVDVLPTAFDHEGERRWIVSLTPKRLRSPAHRLVDVVIDGGDMRAVADRLVSDWLVQDHDDPEQARIETFVVMNAGNATAEVASSGGYPEIDRALLDPSTHEAFVEHHRDGVIHSTLTDALGGPFAEACARVGLPAAHVGSATSRDGVRWWVVWLIDDAAFALKLLNADIPRLAALRVLSHVLDRDRIERELRMAAGTDSLTGLPNRGHFDAFVGTTDAAPGDAVVFLDVDDFKSVNDTHGHHVGDAVLSEIGRRVAATCEPDDVVARIGGDEFVVVVRAASDECAALVGRLEAAMRQPISTPVGAVQIHVTVGVAATHHETGLDELVRRADLAMLQRKRSRRTA